MCRGFIKKAKMAEWAFSFPGDDFDAVLAVIDVDVLVNDEKVSSGDKFCYLKRESI